MGEIIWLIRVIAGITAVGMMLSICETQTYPAFAGLIVLIGIVVELWHLVDKWSGRPDSAQKRYEREQTGSMLQSVIVVIGCLMIPVVWLLSESGTQTRRDLLQACTIQQMSQVEQTTENVTEHPTTESIQHTTEYRSTTTASHTTHSSSVPQKACQTAGCFNKALQGQNYCEKHLKKMYDDYKKTHPTRKHTSTTTEFDPDDHDIEGYYEDNRDMYENIDDAYDGFEDDEDAWEDY